LRLAVYLHLGVGASWMLDTWVVAKVYTSDIVVIQVTHTA